MKIGRIALLKSYKDKSYFSGFIRWLLQDDKGTSVYCDRCGNIANGVMRVERESGVYNIPLCKNHIEKQFPNIEYCPCYVNYERPKKAGKSTQQRSLEFMFNLQT